MHTFFNKQFCKSHWLALVMAFVVGVIYVAPHLLFKYELGETYKGIYMSRTYDEDYYNAIVRQVYDGVPVTTNPHSAEYPEKSISTMYNFSQGVVGHIGKTLGMSITTLALASKFIFPALVFLVVYFSIFVLTKSRSAALLAAFAMLLTQELAPLNPASAVKTFLFDSPFHHFLLFSRPINPQINSLFFFGTLGLYAALWNNPRSRTLAVWAGIATGILGYIYFYYWNFTVILSGIILVYALTVRNRELAKNLLISIVVALLVASPYLYQMFQVLFGGFASVQKNYVLTHRFIIEKIILLPLVILAVMYARNYFKKGIKSLDRVYQFLTMLLLAGFVASNQQVIHGFEVQQHHYHFMTNIPVFIIVMSVLVAFAVNRYAHAWKKPLFTLIFILIAFQAVSIQAASYRFWKPTFTEYQSYAPFFASLEENARRGEVVYANDVLSELIPIYSDANVYSSLHMSVYPVPHERLEHNYFIHAYLDGVREQDAREYMYKEENRNRIGQHIFEGQYWRAVCGSFGCFPDATLDDLVEKYKKFLETPFEHNLKKYKIDYVMWDKKKDPEWKLDEYKFLESVMSEKEILLFQVK